MPHSRRGYYYGSRRRSRRYRPFKRPWDYRRTPRSSRMLEVQSMALKTIKFNDPRLSYALSFNSDSPGGGRQSDIMAWNQVFPGCLTVQASSRATLFDAVDEFQARTRSREVSAIIFAPVRGHPGDIAEIIPWTWLRPMTTAAKPQMPSPEYHHEQTQWDHEDRLSREQSYDAADDTQKHADDNNYVDSPRRQQSTGA